MNSDIKILIITPWFGEFAGGAEVQSRGLATEFIKRGIDCKVFCTCSKSPYDSWWSDYYKEGVYEVYGVETHRFKTNKEKNRYESAVAKIIKSEELTDEEKTDFFICGINSNNLLKAVEQYINDGFKPIVLPYFHGLTHSIVNAFPKKISVIPCFHNEPQFRWKNIGVLLENAKNVFFNSYAEKNLCLKVYGLEIGKMIANSVVTGEGVELDSRIDDGNINSMLPEEYFLYIGRKEHGKNVHILCDWFLKYKEASQNNSKLVLIGGGDTSILPKHDAIVDFGYVSEQEKNMIIKNTEAVINLSENESFSLVIMEAWLQAKPVIVSSLCGVTLEHAIISNGGLSVGNSEEFKKALEFIRSNTEKAQYLGQNGKKYVEKNFSYDIVLEKYLRELAGGL